MSASRISNRRRALRALEIHRAYFHTKRSSVALFKLPNTMFAGGTVRLASMLQKRDIIKANQAYAIGAILQMSRTDVETSLSILESLDLIDIRRNLDNNIIEVEERIADVGYVLHTIGGLLNNPSEEMRQIRRGSLFEESFVQVLDHCAQKLHEETALVSELDIDEELLNKIMDIGETRGILGRIKDLDGRVIIYSPIMYFNKYEQLKKFIESHSSPTVSVISDLMERLRGFPGHPMDRLPKEELHLAREGIKEGFIIPSHTDPAGSKKSTVSTFLFPPLPEFKDSVLLGDVFEKSKTMITSLRHAQFFGEPTLLRSPRLLIDKLLRDEQIGFHSSGKVQYLNAAVAGIVNLDEGIGRTFLSTKAFLGYRPTLIRSTENIDAVELARQLILSSELSAREILNSDQHISENVFETPSFHLPSLEYRGALRYKSKRSREVMKALEDIRFRASGGIRL